MNSQAPRASGRRPPLSASSRTAIRQNRRGPRRFWSAVASEARHRFGFPRSGGGARFQRGSAGSQSAVAAGALPAHSTPFGLRLGRAMFIGVHLRLSSLDAAQAKDRTPGWRSNLSSGCGGAPRGALRPSIPAIPAIGLDGNLPACFPKLMVPAGLGKASRACHCARPVA